MATSRIPKLAGKDFENMVTWFNTMNSLDLLFHPDDDPSDIVDIKSGVRVFTDEEAQELQVIMADLFETHGARVYDGAAPAFEQVLGGEVSHGVDSKVLKQQAKQAAVNEFIASMHTTVIDPFQTVVDALREGYRRIEFWNISVKDKYAEVEDDDLAAMMERFMTAEYERLLRGNVAESAVEESVRNFVRRTNMDSNNKNQEIDLAAIKTALERGQYGIDLMIQNAREPSSWDDDLKVINAQLAIVNAALAKPVAQEVTEEAFDVNKHCEGVALNYYLDSVDEDATMEQVVDALNAGDRESLEVFGIEVNSAYDHEHNAVIANWIEAMHQMLIDNIAYVQSKKITNVSATNEQTSTKSDFDLSRYCERVALGNCLSKCSDSASMQEVVKALRDVDIEKIEGLNVVVAEQFEGDDPSEVADMIENGYRKLFAQISFAHARLNEAAMPASVASSEAVSSEEIKAIAERKVLEEILASKAIGSFDEIVDAIESDDADQLEILNVVLSDDYMNDDGLHTARVMRRMVAIMEESLQETIQVSPSQVIISPSLLADIRNLCKAVEDGDPQTISDRMLSVQGYLPPLSKQEVLDDLSRVWANKYGYKEGLDVEGWFQLIVEVGAKPISGGSNEFSSFAWASEQEALQKLTDMSGSDRDELFERVVDYRENNYLFVLDVFRTDTGAFETLGRDVELANVFSQASAHVAQANWERSGGELAPFDLRDTDSNVVGRGFILSASPRANREKLEELKANKPDDGVQVVIDVEKLLLSVRNPYDNWYKPLAAEIQCIAESKFNESVMRTQRVDVENDANLGSNTSIAVNHVKDLEEKRIIVVVRGGVVSGVCSSDPDLSVEVLDYDNIDEANMTEEEQALSDEADSLNPVY